MFSVAIMILVYFIVIQTFFSSKKSLISLSPDESLFEDQFELDDYQLKNILKSDPKNT